MISFLISLFLYVVVLFAAFIASPIWGRRIPMIGVLWGSYSCHKMFLSGVINRGFWDAMLLIFHLIILIIFMFVASMYTDEIKKNSIMKKKNRKFTMVISMILGGLGGHKFYLNRWGLGYLYLFFSWTFIPSIVGILECIYFFNMEEKKFNLKYNTFDNKSLERDGVKVNEFNEKASTYQKEDMDGDESYHNCTNHDYSDTLRDNVEKGASEINITNYHITIGSINAKGVLEDFTLCIRDRNGNEYEFHSIDGEICSIKSNRMLQARMYVGG